MTSYNRDWFDIHRHLPSIHNYHGGLHMAYLVPSTWISGLPKSRILDFSSRSAGLPYNGDIVRRSLPCKLHSYKHNVPTYILDLPHILHDVPKQCNRAHDPDMDVLLESLVALESRVSQNSLILKSNRISF